MSFQGVDKYGMSHQFVGPKPTLFDNSPAGRWVNVLLELLSQGFMSPAEVQAIINRIFEDC